MALAPGTLLGPYKVSAQIGAGGMGEVYKAVDTRLERTVAIKVLAPEIADNPDLRQRFEREAKSLAALSHPNICPIHDVGSADGIHFLVMEFLEGETLAQRLESGALPLDRALTSAIEIADALDKAHRAGIVHRDLKPGNIMLTRSGAKLLDFGLAKSGAPVTPGGGLSMMPTTPANLTVQGTILGTFQYMAPEQLDGQEADARTDIFAFGAVLYEMVTGRKAFEGKSQASLIHAIMGVEPPAMGTLLPTLPASLDRVVRTCLAKDPENRWQSTRDLGRELQRIARGDEAPAEPLGGMRWGRLLVAGAAGLALGVIATALTFVMRTPPQPPAAVRHASVLVAVDGTAGVPLSNDRPSIDNAGRVIVVAGRSADGTLRLFGRRFDDTDAVPIPGTEGISDTGGFAVSPDGAWVAFAANRQIRKVALGGGSSVVLGPAPDTTPGLAWAGTDSIIVGEPSGLVRIPAAGGDAVKVTTVDTKAGEVDHRMPFVTPDGTLLAYTVWFGALDTARIRVRSLVSGEERTLMLGDTPTVTPTGYLVFGRSTALWAAPFEPATLDVSREAVPVIDGVQNLFAGYTQYALSAEGTLVYQRRIERTPPPELLDRSGARINTLGEAIDGVLHGPPRFSPDGAFMAVCRHPVGGGDQIVIHDLRRGGTIAIGGSDSRNPVWSPDGTRIAFMSRRNGTADIFEIDARRGGEPRPLLVREGDQIPWSWRPDGSALVFSQGTSRNSDVWVLPRGGEPSPILADPSYSEGEPAFSLDGRFLAYVSDESGRREVYVHTYPEGGGRVIVSTSGGHGPTWTRDRLYFQDLEGTLFFVPVSASGGIPQNPTPQRVMNVPEGAETIAVTLWDVARDGQSFVVLRDYAPALGSLELVLNWHEELKRLASAPSR